MTGKIRSNNNQINKMIDYMNANKNFARGDMSTLQVEIRNAMWQRLTDHLNKMGPTKTLEQWKQTWRDLKKKGRKINERRKQGLIDKDAEIPRSTLKIIQTIEHILTEPDESENGRIMDTSGEERPSTPGFPDDDNLVEDETVVFEYTDLPLAEESMDVLEDSEANVLIHEPDHTSRSNARCEKKRNTGTSSSNFLSLQEDHNFLLTRICGLMEEANTLRREKNNLMRQQIRQSKRCGKASIKPKLSF